MGRTESGIRYRRDSRGRALVSKECVCGAVWKGQPSRCSQWTKREPASSRILFRNTMLWLKDGATSLSGP